MGCARSGEPEPERYLKLASNESVAKQALDDLRAANQDKQHLAGVEAFDRVPPTSSYYGAAVEMIEQIRAHYLQFATPNARQLAADGKCQELAALQVEAVRIGREVGEALAVYKCIQAAAQ